MEQAEDVQQAGSQFLGEFRSLPVIDYAVTQVSFIYRKIKFSCSIMFHLIITGELFVDYLKDKSRPLLRYMEKPLSVLDVRMLRFLEFVKSLDPVVTMPLVEAGERLNSLPKDIYNTAVNYLIRISEGMKPSIDSYDLGLRHFITHPDEWLSQLRWLNPCKCCIKSLLCALTELVFKPITVLFAIAAEVYKKVLSSVWALFKFVSTGLDHLIELLGEIIADLQALSLSPVSDKSLLELVDAIRGIIMGVQHQSLPSGQEVQPDQPDNP